MPNHLAGSINDAVIRRLADTQSYQRGLDYYSHGHVESLEDMDESVRAVVRGNQDYTVTLGADDGVLDYSCDCPVGSDGTFCKHCVAAALAWLKRAAPARSSGRGRALTLYPIPGRRGEVEEALWRARRWLLANHPQNTEERNMRLMGLTWTKAARQEIDAAVAEVLARQEAEGGWRQLPQWSPDAYATGMALCALRESGMNPGDAPYRKGVAFLLQNQYRDGSWFVKTRSSPVQPYFESGYPFGSNQWISAQGAAWATLAIAATLPDAKPTASAERARP